MTPRPATGKTPIRGIRVPEGLWRAAQAKAKQRGETLTEVIMRALHRYVREPDRRVRPPDPE